MHPRYRIADTSAVCSPALLFYADLIRDNVALAVKMAGDPQRLRPHVKTHKTREIVRMELAAGVTKHKCATLAEAEMVASCGAPDVFLAYNIVGPNRDRLVKLLRTYTGTRFSVQADHPDAQVRRGSGNSWEIWDLALFRDVICSATGGTACVADHFGSVVVREDACLGEAGGFGNAP